MSLEYEPSSKPLHICIQQFPFRAWHTSRPQREQSRVAGGTRSRNAGVPRSQETTASLDPTVALYLGPYGGPKKGGQFLMSEVPLYMRLGRAD